MSRIEKFDSREALFAETARLIAQSLIDEIAENDVAVLVGSGGGTPKPVYELLSNNSNVPWEKVVVTLTDERRAPEDAAVDNARMVKASLMQGPAAAARFVALDDVDALDSVPDRFATVLMGMGGDGHFASIFPHSEGSENALQNNSERIVGVTPEPLPPEAPYPRWTLTKPALCNTTSMLLLITGENKREILERAMEDGPVLDLPIRALLRDENLPLRILWAA